MQKKLVQLFYVSHLVLRINELIKIKFIQH